MADSSAPNSVARSRELVALFHPAAVAASELRGTGEPQRMLPEERQCVPHAGAKRLREFAAGRACARHALAALGVEAVCLPMRDGCLPAWPPGFVGSITHTDGYCGAVVASGRNVASLGIDTEVVERVSSHLWPRICTPQELDRIGGLTAVSAIRAAALLFVAKEAWYKCQFPLSRQWFEFGQVTVEWDGLDDGRGGFSVGLVQVPTPGRELPVPRRGQFRFHEIYVSAGIAFAA